VDVHHITRDLAVAPQIRPDDIPAVASAGFRSILCNRPDAEAPDQTNFREIERRAGEGGLVARDLPVTSGRITDADVAAFEAAADTLPKPTLAYCRTGTRSATLWSLAEARRGRAVAEILAATKAAGYDLKGTAPRMAAQAGAAKERTEQRFAIVIVGGGAAGLAAASSLKARKPDLEVAVIDPADIHYYQPGWTLVGAGVFDPEATVRTMASLIPDGVTWIKAAVVAFEPQRKAVMLEDGRTIGYDRLVVAPGLKLDWDGIEGRPRQKPGRICRC